MRIGISLGMERPAYCRCHLGARKGALPLVNRGAIGRNAMHSSLRRAKLKVKLSSLRPAKRQSKASKQSVKAKRQSKASKQSDKAKRQSKASKQSVKAKRSSLRPERTKQRFNNPAADRKSTTLNSRH